MGEEILVETPLVGRHQLRNVALAVAAADELSRLIRVESGAQDGPRPGSFLHYAAVD